MTGLQTIDTKEQTLHAIRDELPALLRGDPSLSAHILAVAREHFPTRVETEDKFTRMLNQLARDREEDRRRWDEHKAEDQRKWDEHKAEDRRKWEEQNRKWDEQNRKWDEHKAEDRRKWDEQNRKWEESSRRFDQMHREIMSQEKRHNRSIGALGARWGLQTERAFRDGLAAILEESFGVRVLNVNEFDDEGTVFGKPDQVELDIIIKNGLLIACEIKSSVDKPAMYSFERKARFYERRHGKKINRMMVISPMIEERARRVGKELGIEMYVDSVDVPAA